MNYLLVFYTGTEIKNAIIKKGESINVGSGEDDNIKIQNCGLEANHLTLRFMDGGINIFSRTPFSIAGETSVNRIVSAGDSVKISKHLMLIIFESCCYFENPISLNGLKEINIGRSVKNDICLKGLF